MILKFWSLRQATFFLSFCLNWKKCRIFPPCFFEGRTNEHVLCGISTGYPRSWTQNGYADPCFGVPRLPLEVVSARLKIWYGGCSQLRVHSKIWEYRAEILRYAYQNLGVPGPKTMSCKWGFSWTLT